MAKTKTETEKKPNSIFKKLEITSLRDIFELYLFYELTQEAVNNIATECGKFLHHSKKVSLEVLPQFSIHFSFSKDRSLVIVQGTNLLSSLWIIGVYPENPENLVDKTTYSNGDFNYKFYTKNKNLSIKKIRKNERKLANHP